MARIRRWRALALAALCGQSPAAASANYVRDGCTTYCWAFNASSSDVALSRDSLVSSGSGAECPLELTVVSSNSHVNEWIPLSWTVTVDHAYASSANSTESAADTASSALSSSSSSSSSEAPQRFVIVHSAIHLCGQDVSACDPFSTQFRNANLTMTHVTNLSHFSNDDSITFRSNGEVAFSTPGELTLAAYLILPGIGADQRHDFIAYATIRVDATPNTSVQVASDNDKSSGQVLGITLAQFISITAGIVVIFACAITAIVVVTRRRRRRRRQQRELEQQQHDAKVSQTAAMSPVTGDSQHFRFSDWSEIYATQDTLPSSILVDDSTTIAILRASRVSSSPASSITERRVADFTRGGGYWDVRPSASPITPLSSMFFAHHSMESINSARDDRELGSPVDSFVPLETLGRRRTRPCHADALSDSDEEEAEEVEF